MAKGKQRQALAVSARLAPQSFEARAVLALQEEAARIVAEDAEKRLNGGISGHIVANNGVLSGFLKDSKTTVQFANGVVAVATHD